jgi:hypothetical protein
MPLFCAGPVMHLWVAERFCSIYGIEDPKIIKEIIIGTEFPDIRYISSLKREETHFNITDIKEVWNCLTPFELGMRLHSWLDNVRESFISKTVYDEVSLFSHNFSATLLKFIEEEGLSDIYDGSKWGYLFEEPLPQEVYLVNEDTVLRWHNILYYSLWLRPSCLLFVQSYRSPAFGIPVEILYEWSCALPALKNRPIFQEHFQSLIKYIEDKLRGGIDIVTYHMP